MKRNTPTRSHFLSKLFAGKKRRPSDPQSRRRLLMESLEERRVFAAPVIDSLVVSPVIAENSDATLTLNFTDLDSADTHNVIINWNDGGPQTNITLPVGARTYTTTRRYADNADGTIASNFTIDLSLSDGVEAPVLAQRNVRVENSLPSITQLSANSVDEGGTVTLDGTFTDRAKLNDTYFLIVSWDGGANFDGPFPITATPVNPGDPNDFRMTFSTTHLYPDDNPTGTTQDLTTIVAVAIDSDSDPTVLVSQWSFDEPGGTTAFDLQGTHNGTIGAGATRVAGLIGPGALTFNNTGAANVNVGTDEYSFTNGITIEALIRPTWSGNSLDYDEIFRKEDGGNRILFSFQNDPNNGGASPAVPPGPVLSLGLNIGGAYQELDMPLNVDLTAIGGGNAGSGTIFLNDPGVPVGPNDVVLKDGNTHYVVAVYDKDTGEKAIYVDGVKRFSRGYGAGTAIVTGGGTIAYIGNTSGLGEPFTGVIDEVAIYDRGLTATEIAGHYNDRVLTGQNYQYSVTQILVTNVAPVVVAGGDATLFEGENFTRAGSFTDVGVNDTFIGTVNYGDGTGVQGLTLTNGTFTLDHVYADNGIYTVVVTITDDDLGQGTANFNLTVNNQVPNVPTIPPSFVNEGETYALSAIFGDFGTLDTHTVNVNWGDTTSSAATVNELTFGPPGSVTGMSGTATANHVYADNGTYNVTVTVTDDDGGTTNSLYQVTVGNVAPVVPSIADKSATEGQIISLSDAPFTDAGTLDTHTATINWGDGTATEALVVTDNITGPPGNVLGMSGLLNGSHVYADDGVYQVMITLIDKDNATTTAQFQAIIGNAAPTLTTLAPQSINEGGTFNLSVPFNDLGTLDTHTATIDWGDGSPVVPATVTATPFGPPGNVAGLNGTISGNHVYPQSGSYTVTVTVTDDNGGTNSTTVALDVGNVAPVVSAGANQIVNEGQTVNLAGSFTDPGADTHIASIDWGDGTVTSGTVDDLAKTVAGSHVYADNGIYTVTLTVTDSDNAVGSSQFTVTANNVAAVITPVPNVSINEGVPFNSALATFIDAGTADTHTATIDWGDGTPVQAAIVTEVNGAGSVLPSAPKLFPDSGTFQVVVTVSDDDGATSSATFQFTVINVAPTVVIDGLTETVRNYPTTYTFSAINDAADDLAADIVYDIDWDGDGNIDETVVGPAGGVEVVHAFGVKGTNTIIAYATDKDGGTSDPAFFDVEVSVFALIPNDEGLDDLVFGGTFGADRIVVSLLNNGQIQIRNNDSYFKVPLSMDITGRIVIYAGGGNDSIVVAGNVPYDMELHGDAGSDYIAGGRYNDILDGGAGVDRLIDNSGNNTFIGGDGNDRIVAGRGNDVIFGGKGWDSISGGAGDDIIDGGEGNDSILGQDGDDILIGGDGNDVIRGDRGNDIILGGNSNDNLQGGVGRDVIVGGNGGDQIYGGIDDDILIHGDLDLGNGGDFESDIASLMMIMFDWNKPTPITTRINNLSDRLNDFTILDDHTRDALYGQGDEDWFLTTFEFGEARDFKLGIDEKTDLFY